MNYAALEDKLGYRFKNPDLLRQALTHPSTDSRPETPSYETEEKGPRDSADRFESRVFWHGHAVGAGRGSSKRKAEVAAAADALARREWVHITL